jgi:hypothetical protein
MRVHFYSDCLIHVLDRGQRKTGAARAHDDRSHNDMQAIEATRLHKARHGICPALYQDTFEATVK